MRHSLLTVCLAAGFLGLLPDPATAQFCDCDVSASRRNAYNALLDVMASVYPGYNARQVWAK